MANQKITDLAAITSAVGTDVIEIVSNPGGTPVSKKITVDNLFKQRSFTNGIGVGGATAGTGGVAFPATAVAVADANTLDDYEEGTFPVTIQFGGAAVDVTYDATWTAGKYTKIGNVVFFSLTLTLTSKGSSAGTVTIHTLPLTSSSSKAAPALSIRPNKITFANQMFAQVAVAGTSIALYEPTEGGTQTQLTNADFANDSDILIAGFYFI